MLQISQNSPPKRNECVTYTHSMGVLTSGGGLRDYHDPSICAVQLLRQCLLRFGVTRIPPYILPCADAGMESPLPLIPGGGGEAP